MKIFHMSDIHLGRRPAGGIGEFSNKRYNDYFIAFEKLCRQAIGMNAEVVIIAGDFFDRKELFPEVLARAEMILQTLKDNQIKVILTEGNHDNITTGKESESWLVYLEEKGYVQRPTYYFDGENYIFEPVKIDDIFFYGLGYPGSLIEETLDGLYKFLSGKKNQKNIAVVHTAISGGDILPGTVTRESIDKLKDRVIYIAGGHFHSYYTYPAENPFFFIPGCPEYWDLAETGKRGAVFFDSDTGKHELVESFPRKIHSLKLQVQSSCEDDFRKEYSDFINNLSLEPGEDIIFMKLVLEIPFYFDTLWCEDQLMKLGALKVLLKSEYPGETETIDISSSMTPVKSVEEEIIKGWKYFSKDSEKSVQVLERLKEFQRENNKDSFSELMDHMLDDILSGEVSDENS